MERRNHSSIQTNNIFNKTVMNNSFYTIVYVSPSHLTEEKFSVGLFVNSNGTCYFKFDKVKINKLSSIFDISNSLIKDTLEDIKQNVLMKSNIRDTLFESNTTIKEAYFSYLSRYCNNLISFSSPNELLMDSFNENLFNNLYNKLILFSLTKQEKIKSYKERVKEQVKPKIQKHVSIDFNATSELFKDLIIPTKLDFIGKNSRYVSGEFIDFNIHPTTLKNNISHYINFSSSVKNLKSFIIGEEPTNKRTVNFDIWRALIETNKYQFVPFKEFEIVEEYFSSHDVTPMR